MISKLNKSFIAVLLSIFLLSCTDDNKTLKVGSKPFTESMLLAEMIAQLAENEGIKVERSIPFGPTNQIIEAIKQKVVDVYPEYNGTGLIFLGQSPTSDGSKSTAILKKLFKPLGLEMTGKFGFSNDYAMVMTAERAKELGVTTIADLATLGSPVRYAVNQSFLERPVDGLRPMNRRYGIENSSIESFPPDSAGKDKIIAALLAGSADVGEMFMTDGQIAEYNLVVLKDNKGFFPVYEVAPLVRTDSLASIKNLQSVLNKLEGAISALDMQTMNKAVDLEARSVASVATAYLVQKGLISKDKVIEEAEQVLFAVDPSISLNNQTALAMRGVRAGFPKKNIQLFNTKDPLNALATKTARVAMVGAESFYEIKDGKPVSKGTAEAFSVIGYKMAHLISRQSGEDSLSSMKKVLTGSEGSSSDIVLRMILNSYGLADQITVINSSDNINKLVDELNNETGEAIFVMNHQGDGAISKVLQDSSYKLLSLNEWANGGHTAKYSFIRPATIRASVYQNEAVETVATQFVLAGPVKVSLLTGDVGPGNVSFREGDSPVPLTEKEVNDIRDSLGTSERIDPAIPVHAALIPKIEVIDKSLPFSFDVSFINLLMILFLVWVIYLSMLPAPKDLTIDD